MTAAPALCRSMQVICHGQLNQPGPHPSPGIAMRKTWSGSYQRLDGEEPIPPPVDSSGSLGDSSIKGSNVFLAPGPILHSVDSDLRFHPAAVLKSTRRWLHIDQHGLAKHVEIDKHRLVADLEIRYRDLLSLDPSVPIPAPASLSVREKAMVVNLETIRMIICANQVYLLSVPKEGEPLVAAAPSTDNPFVSQLCRVLGASSGGGGSSGGGSSGVGLSTGRAAAALSRGPSMTMQPLAGPSFDLYCRLPYELRALECALDAAVRQLSSEVAELERRAYPAIEQLATAVSRDALETVRSMKGAMNELTGRVQRIRQEIEKIMGHEVEVHDMCLGRKAALLGQDLPPEPSSLAGPSRPHRTFPNLLALQQEPPAPPLQRAPSGSASGASPPPPQQPLGRPASEGRELGDGLRRAGGAEGSGPAGAGEGGLWRAARAASAQSLPGAAAGAGHGGGGGGSSRAQELWGRGGVAMRRAGVVVRTVRRLRRAAKPGQQAGAEGEAPGGGGGGGGGGSAEGSGESLTGDLIEEEVVEELPGLGPTLLPHEVEEAEDLLEAYFMQVDYLLRRLMLLNERTGATECLLSIEMDHRRNELVALDLFVTCVTGGFTFVGCVAGIFGMNLALGSWAQSQTAFALVAVLASLGGAALLVLILLYIRKRRLMFISTVT